MNNMKWTTEIEISVFLVDFFLKDPYFCYGRLDGLSHVMIYIGQ